jgi:malate dehydrogenase
LGTGGVEKVLEIELNEQEKTDFQKSVAAVKSLVDTMNKLMAA